MKILNNYLISSAEYYPNRIAIESSDDIVTYSEMLNISNGIGQLLLCHGIDSDINVVICLPKNVYLYSSIFGILFSGKCFVPTNYLIPSERLNYIIDDSLSSFLITTWKKLNDLVLAGNYVGLNSCGFAENEIVIAKFVRVAGTLKISRVLSVKNSFIAEVDVKFPNVLAASPACLLYTSGSTGFPKGILHSHKSVSTFIEWSVDYLLLTSDDYVAQKSSVDFDLSIFEIFATIKVGGRLLPIPDHMYVHPLKLVDYIFKKNITVLYTVPSTLLNSISPLLLKMIKKSMLRHIIFAGEPILKEPLLMLFSHLPTKCCMHNWYGPTETNVCSYFRITNEALMSDEEIPIGIPCSYSDFNMADIKKNMGDKKELLISSKTIMEGYWNQENPENKFIYKDGKKYYRSGDLVTQNERGEYVYHGRIDRQIKLRGYRIQLEEVELTVSKLEGVKEAVAIIREQQLILYVTSSGKEDLDQKCILDHCIKMLSRYMIPHEIFIIDQIPRNVRGKVDFTMIKNICLTPAE